MSGWTFRKAAYTPVWRRVKLFARLTRESWRLRKHHGGTVYTLWTNFRLATWLRPS